VGGRTDEVELEVDIGAVSVGSCGDSGVGVGGSGVCCSVGRSSDDSAVVGPNSPTPEWLSRAAETLATHPDVQAVRREFGLMSDLVQNMILNEGWALVKESVR
jgi:hypothetical protein